MVMNDNDDDHAYVRTITKMCG